MTDTAAVYGMGGWPFWAVIVGLFVVVMGRSHLFYWLGRGVVTSAVRLADQVPGVGDTANAPGRRDTEDSAGVADPGSMALAVGRADASGAGEAPATDTVPEPEATGRGAAARAGVTRLMRTPTARRGLALVHRWGPLAVTMAYLTVGLQTAVFVGSGLVRMPYLRFTLASVPGSMAWAFVWGTVGLGAVWAAARLTTASPWGLAGVVVAAAVLVTWLVVRRRARTASAASAEVRTDELV